MVRSAPATELCLIGFPHARGDGPIFNVFMAGLRSFSPRAWGWSGYVRRYRLQRLVFPTRVGMVRGWHHLCACDARFPHARGDGPYSSSWSVKLWPFSPRAWGWSGQRAVLPQSGGVFPTRVGMVRTRRNTPPASSSFPHARGDGPRILSPSPSPASFSPRAWGWSVDGVRRQRGRLVFPTRVGMVRAAPSLRSSSGRFPHARGDGPRAAGGYTGR